jgi:hypothetical protein
MADQIILSFDIGVKNLAYCLCKVSAKNVHILEWNIITIEVPSKSGINVLSQEIIRTLHEVFIQPDQQIDVVLIENQPALKNPIMKTVQIILHTFFMMHAKDGPYSASCELIGDVQCVSAQSKNNISKIIPKEVKSQDILDLENMAKSYSKNKKLSVLNTKLILEKSTNVSAYESGLHHMMSHKNDAFLQLIASSKIPLLFHDPAMDEIESNMT